MARFKSILGEIRGSIAGVTFSRNGNSAYARNRAIPVNPRSSGQTEARLNLAFVSAAWRALTQGEQNAWKALAVTVPYTNSVGDSSTYSGFQLYVKLNLVRRSNGLGLITTAPASAPVFPVVVWSNVAFEQSQIDFTDITFGANIGLSAPAVGFFVQFDSTGVGSGGRNFINPSEYRFIAKGNNPSGGPFTLDTAWVNVYGSPTQSLLGGALFVRMRLVETATGFTQPWQEFKVPVIDSGV